MYNELSTFCGFGRSISCEFLVEIRTLWRRTGGAQVLIARGVAQLPILSIMFQSWSWQAWPIWSSGRNRYLGLFLLVQIDYWMITMHIEMVSWKAVILQDHLAWLWQSVTGVPASTKILWIVVKKVVIRLRNVLQVLCLLDKTSFTWDASGNPPLKLTASFEGHNNKWITFQIQENWHIGGLKPAGRNLTDTWHMPHDFTKAMAESLFLSF